MLYIKEKDSDIWGPLQSRPRHNQSPVNSIRTKEDVVKANKSAPTNIPGVPGHKGLTYNLADLDKFVKRKIAKYNNNVSGKGLGTTELLQENLFNIQQNLFDKQQSLFDTQANAEERTEY